MMRSMSDTKTRPATHAESVGSSPAALGRRVLGRRTPARGDAPPYPPLLGQILACCLLLPCCSSEAGSTAATDAGQDAPPATGLATYGEPCSSTGECETGLCLHGGYAGFGWCTRECDDDGAPCEPDSRGSYGGWCAKLPADYPDEPRQFCLPVCKTIHQCNGLSDLWEDCDVPSWKGNPLPSNEPGVLVCLAPSAHGKKPVDPETCDGWSANFQDVPTQVGVCKAFCDYLVWCKEVADPVIYNRECCAYGCMLRMTPEGQVDTVYEKKIKCYWQNFDAYRGTPQVCTAHEQDPNCGGKPEDPRPQ